MSDFKKLEVWRKAHALTLNIDRAAKSIRGSQRVSLRVQMVRAAMSIPTNLVEGTGQRTAKEYARFVRIALNSASELEYHLLLARDFHAITQVEFDSLSSQTIEVRRMLYG
ncbi:MAG: four helix bundle protein, partial [Gemmatimonadota bacterium]|nr:four helix bundle protein [Gemmatimonadota bacterium]